jgi:hypothetical protein
MKVIKGGRAQLEQEAVAALLDPNGKDRADSLFARLKRRGTLRGLDSLQMSSDQAEEVTPTDPDESQRR